MSWKGCVTNAGNNMLNTLQQGVDTLHITGATVGSGTRSESEMRSATALVNSKGAVSIVSKRCVTKSGITYLQLKVRIGAAQAAYTAHEIGIWAHLNDDTDQLFALHQDAADGLPVPASSVTPDFKFDINVIVYMSNTDDLEVAIDYDESATIADIEAALEGVASTNTATPTSDGLMSADDKAKMDGIEAGANAYTHPTHTAQAGVPTANQTPSFGGTFKVGQVSSDSEGHVTGVTERTVKIPSNAATQSAAGLMSSGDKAKLDGIEAQANKYTHPGYTAKSSGLYKVTIDGTGHVSAATAVQKSDITGLGIPAQDTTYGAATQSANGLMSAADKAKLDGIADQANKYTHPAYTAQTGKPTGAVSVALGNPFTVSQIKSDATGHVTDTTDRAITVTHPASGATAGSYGDSANQTPGFGGTFKALRATIDANGHVTALSAHNVTIPSSPATSSAAGLMSAADKAAHDDIISNGVYGKGGLAESDFDNAMTPGVFWVTSTTTTVNWPSDVSLSSTRYGVLEVERTAANSSIRLQRLTLYPDGIIYTRMHNNGVWYGWRKTPSAYTHPSYTARTGKPTADQTPGFGSTFTLSQVTSDATGHVTGMTDRTVKIPSTTASTSAAGLMSAADKTELNNFADSGLRSKDRPTGVNTLNDYKTPGYYFVSKSSVANGWPTEVGTGSASYSLIEVIKFGTGTVINYMQRLTANINSDDLQCFVRVSYNNSTWTEWAAIRIVTPV